MFEYDVSDWFIVKFKTATESHPELLKSWQFCVGISRSQAAPEMEPV